ncbi:hypothetical protein JCM10908_005807 [Rhodotorula pacifica]|uniref:uncharacterized protein n=1 Tax=Rhodotorula pacifica TaxID=1495444 RepID=UPI00316EABD6
MEEARQAGKCRFIGSSAMSATSLRRVAKVAQIDFVEMEFSPVETAIEDKSAHASSFAHEESKRRSTAV